MINSPENQNQIEIEYRKPSKIAFLEFALKNAKRDYQDQNRFESAEEVFKMARDLSRQYYEQNKERFGFENLMDLARVNAQQVREYLQKNNITPEDEYYDFVYRYMRKMSRSILGKISYEAMSLYQTAKENLINLSDHNSELEGLSGAAKIAKTASIIREKETETSSAEKKPKILELYKKHLQEENNRLIQESLEKDNTGSQTAEKTKKNKFSKIRSGVKSLFRKSSSVLGKIAVAVKKEFDYWASDFKKKENKEKVFRPRMTASLERQIRDNPGSQFNNTRISENERTDNN